MTSDVENSKPGQRADNCQTVGSWDDTLFLHIFYLLNSENARNKPPHPLVCKSW